MKKKTLLKMLMVGSALLATFSSCIKDELPNSECDILVARAGVATPEDVFIQLSDTLAPINKDYGASVIQFQNVIAENLTTAAPVFTVSEGATLVPASGTVRDFSNGAMQVYFCVAQDESALLQEALAAESPATVLAAAAKAGQHVRPYYVQYKPIEAASGDVVEYNFENFYLETKSQKYYEWSDEPYAGGSTPAVSKWATANAGISVARGSAKPDEYPTVPLVGGGVDGGNAVKLETCSTGSWGKMFKMPLGAGNLFIGTFDMSQALTNTLHATRFGENSTLSRKPYRFVGYYKYTPGPTITNKYEKVVEGIDVPAIYSIVYRNHDENGQPTVLYGDNVTTSPLIVGRAEITDWQYNTSDWVSFSLEYTWYEEIDPVLLEERGYNFAIVCSSSKDGAEYTGALGSVLLVDNFKIYYTAE